MPDGRRVSAGILAGDATQERRCVGNGGRDRPDAVGRGRIRDQTHAAHPSKGANVDT